MEFGQPDFEALRKKSDEQFERQAKEQNKQRSFLEKIQGKGKVSGVDMSHEEAKIVDEFIGKEISIISNTETDLNDFYDDVFPSLLKYYPDLAGYSRDTFKEMIKERLNEFERERKLGEKIKEGRALLHEKGEAQVVIVKEFLRNEYGYDIESDLEKGRFSSALESIVNVDVSRLKKYNIDLFGMVQVFRGIMVPAQIAEFIKAKNIAVLIAIIEKEKDAALFFRHVERFGLTIPREMVKLESFQRGLQAKLLNELILNRGLFSIEAAENFVKIGLMTSEEKEAFFSSDGFREKLIDVISATFEQVIGKLEPEEVYLKGNIVKDFVEYLDFCVGKEVLSATDCALLESKFSNELDSEGEMQQE